MKNITENPDKSLVACKDKLCLYVDLHIKLLLKKRLTADKVSDNCVIVLLKDRYLKTFTQATKTLKAARMVRDLDLKNVG